MTEVAIIGGRVIGCAVALELARQGSRPKIIDFNGEVGHGSTPARQPSAPSQVSTPLQNTPSSQMPSLATFSHSPVWRLHESTVHGTPSSQLASVRQPQA